MKLTGLLLTMISLILSAHYAASQDDYVQTDPLITNVWGRANTTSLNGEWPYAIDPFCIGGRGIHQPHEHKSPNTERIETGFSPAVTLDVPGDFNHQTDKLFYYEGCIWYQKLFDYDLPEGKRLFLHFGAANYITHPYVNGTKLGIHEGGHTPFNFEITEEVKKGENWLVVGVDAGRYKEGVPALNRGWFNYGGITRDVTLVEVPSTFIRDYLVQLEKGNLKKIKGWVELDGEEYPAKVSVEIPELGIEESFEVNTQGWAEIEIDVDEMDYWSPENPKLYDVVITAGEDKVDDRIGFRTIEVQGADILLNGEPIFLRGANVHDEIPAGIRRVSTRGDALWLIHYAKELNCNFLRLAHYPHNEHTIRAADEQGIMLWAEVPVYWGIDWASERAYAVAENMLEAHMYRDKNRASVIIWSIMNETRSTNEDRNTFLKKLYDRTLEIDVTRPVSGAVFMRHPEGEGRNSLNYEVRDPMCEYFDIISINQYVGWYHDVPETADSLTLKVKWDKPVIFSEFGGGALYGFHGEDYEYFSEERQAKIYKHQIGFMKRIENMRGCVPWILLDYYYPNAMSPFYQQGWNRKGIYSETGDKKKVWHVLKKYYDEMEEKY